jgi:hypothetical protein
MLDCGHVLVKLTQVGRARRPGHRNLWIAAGAPGRQLRTITVRKSQPGYQDGAGINVHARLSGPYIIINIQVFRILISVSPWIGDERPAKEMKAPPTSAEQSTLHVLTGRQHRFHGDWPLISPDRFNRAVTGQPLDGMHRHLFFRRSDDKSRAQGTSSDTRQPGLLSALHDNFIEPLRRKFRRNPPMLYPPPDRSASDSGRRQPFINVVPTD